MKWIQKIAEAIRVRIRLRKIEKAIGMKMNRWQRKFILYQNPAITAPMVITMPGGRQNGKTVAACVSVLMYREKPLRMRRALRDYRSVRFGLEISQIPDPPKRPGPDCVISKGAYEYTLYVLSELHAKCRAKGIKVFDLI